MFSISFVILMVLLLVPFAVSAQDAAEDVSTTSETEDVLEESAEVLDEIEELEDLDVEEPTKVPTAFGSWWRNVRETVSLAVTLDDVKKSEKHIRFAEERAKLAAYIAENSDDEKVQERAQKMLEKADQYIQKVEEKKDKLLEKTDERVEKLFRNLTKHHVNKERVFEKLEDKLPPKKLENFQKFRDKVEDRHETFLNNLENDGKAPEDIKKRAIKATKQLKEKRQARDLIREDQKALLERIKNPPKDGDASAEEAFEQMRKERNDKVREVQAAFKAERQEILEAAKNGDKDAVKKLRELNQAKAQERKEVQEKHREQFKLERKGVTGDHDGSEGAMEDVAAPAPKRNAIKNRVQDKKVELKDRAQDKKPDVKQKALEKKAQIKDRVQDKRVDLKAKIQNKSQE